MNGNRLDLIKSRIKEIENQIEFKHSQLKTLSATQSLKTNKLEGKNRIFTPKKLQTISACNTKVRELPTLKKVLPGHVRAVSEDRDNLKKNDSFRLEDRFIDSQKEVERLKAKVKTMNDQLLIVKKKRDLAIEKLKKDNTELYQILEKQDILIQKYSKSKDQSHKNNPEDLKIEKEELKDSLNENNLELLDSDIRPNHISETIVVQSSTKFHSEVQTEIDGNQLLNQLLNSEKVILLNKELRDRIQELENEFNSNSKEFESKEIQTKNENEYSKSKTAVFNSESRFSHDQNEQSQGEQNSVPSQQIVPFQEEKEVIKQDNLEIANNIPQKFNGEVKMKSNKYIDHDFGLTEEIGTLNDSGNKSQDELNIQNSNEIKEFQEIDKTNENENMVIDDLKLNNEHTPLEVEEKVLESKGVKPIEEIQVKPDLQITDNDLKNKENIHVIDEKPKLNENKILKNEENNQINSLGNEQENKEIEITPQLNTEISHTNEDDEDNQTKGIPYSYKIENEFDPNSLVKKEDSEIRTIDSGKIEVSKDEKKINEEEEHFPIHEESENQEDSKKESERIHEESENHSIDKKNDEFIEENLKTDEENRKKSIVASLDGKYLTLQENSISKQNAVSKASIVAIASDHGNQEEVDKIKIDTDESIKKPFRRFSSGGVQKSNENPVNDDFRRSANFSKPIQHNFPIELRNSQQHETHSEPKAILINIEGRDLKIKVLFILRFLFQIELKELENGFELRRYYYDEFSEDFNYENSNFILQITDNLKNLKAQEFLKGSFILEISDSTDILTVLRSQMQKFSIFERTPPSIVFLTSSPGFNISPIALSLQQTLKAALIGIPKLILDSGYEGEEIGKTAPSDIFIEQLADRLVFTFNDNSPKRILIQGFPRSTENTDGWRNFFGTIFIKPALVHFLTSKERIQEFIKKKASKIAEPLKDEYIKNRLSSYGEESKMLNEITNFDVILIDAEQQSGEEIVELCSQAMVKISESESTYRQIKRIFFLDENIKESDIKLAKGFKFYNFDSIIKENFAGNSHELSNDLNKIEIYEKIYLTILSYLRSVDMKGILISNSKPSSELLMHLKSDEPDVQIHILSLNSQEQTYSGYKMQYYEDISKIEEFINSHSIKV